MEEIELMQDDKQKSRVKGQLPEVIFEEGEQNIIEEDEVDASENDFVSKGGKDVFELFGGDTVSYCGVFGKFRAMGGDDLVNDVIDLFRDALHA